METKYKYRWDQTRQYPLIETERLILRGFAVEDASDVQHLAGDKAIASMTLRIPHPYEDGVAEKWIGTHRGKFEQGELVNFAITELKQGYLIGATGLTINKEYENAELGYWIGTPFWNNGYCTEAAKAVLRYGFEELKLQRIYAHHFKRNSASGRVMQAIGMLYEGRLRKHIKKENMFEDLEAYGILKTDYDSAKKG
ncbi:MAG: GNAT family N-acetyltransferase [Phycisphaerae bacterium]|nr:GNAT family N-acetyltransferase [Phycisphaerae bacterium]